nr:hypothetical protein [Pseudonocardia sp. AL041005-10]
MDETPVEPQADAPDTLIPHPAAADPGHFRVDDSDDDDPTLVGPRAARSTPGARATPTATVCPAWSTSARSGCCRSSC